MEQQSDSENSQGQVKPQTYVLVRWIFLRLLGIIHFTAFGSYALQILGLNGSHGISPTADLLRWAAAHLGFERFWLLPTLAWINSSDSAILGMCCAGTAISLLVILGVATAPCLLLLDVLWLSLVTGGGAFTEFQSDGMLVEVTLLALFLAPWQLFEPPWPVPLALRRQRPPLMLSLWLLRFMLFRIMLCSGLVKILSHDSSWTELTAMTYHYETQPIPTPLAWYAHWFPLWVHKLSVAGTFVSELLAPWLIFAPRVPRFIGAALMALLHAMIMLTGNYTFLNYLMIVLCISLLDDDLVRSILPKRLVADIEISTDCSPGNKYLRATINWAAVVFLFLAASRLVTTVSNVVPTPITSMLDQVSPFHIVDSYGLFAIMTKTRPEIVFEGSRDGIVWQSYEFKYKPGDNLKRQPPWVAPHMPRLDWRLWFAAMEPVNNNPWVLSLVKRMLEGSPPVMQFFERNSFSDLPPKYIRAFVYDYHFTNYATRSKTGDWWWRDHKAEYLPPVDLKNGSLEISQLASP